MIVVGFFIILGIGWPSLALAVGEEPPPQPGAKERLQQVLDAEGGTAVYMDPAGNVHTSTTLPNGDHIMRVQPPQSPGRNLGPPLQLHNRTFQLPPPPSVPAQPAVPEFPQKAR
jgi:hypothetical protein